MRNHILFILLLFSLISKADFYSLSGFVYDENNQPIPFVSVFVKNSTESASSNVNGKYFLELNEGTYEIVYKMIGYEEKVLKITIQKNVIQNIWLRQSLDELNEIEVKGSKKDPSYEIIKKAIENKHYYISQYNSLKSKFYIKASEVVDIDSNKIKYKKTKDTVFVKKSSNMNLVEINGVLHYQQPNKIKEIVDGYNLKGKENGLFFLSNTEADFNFYKNLIYSKLTEAPLVSPLNWTAVMSYKYKLVEVYNFNGKEVNRIEIKARKNGNALFEGEIHIVENEWAIKKVDLSVSKKVLNYYDDFRIVQDYTMVDSLWVLSKQKFEYSIKSGKEFFNGKTIVHYEDFEINTVYPKRYFNAELGVKTEESYTRDSTYWNLERPEPLTIEEQIHVAFIDSVEGVINSDYYKDSIQDLTNKIQLKNILWFGQEYVNWRKEKSMYFAPVANMFDPVSPGGFRVGYYLTYYKKFENKKHVLLVPSATYGFRNEDLKGTLRYRFMYDPYHLRQFYGNLGRQFNLINPYDAYINMFKRSNFFEHDFIITGHRMELFNGFYLNTSFEYANRKSIANYDFVLDADNQFFQNDSAQVFNPYKSFSTLIGFDYTPKQKYLREPNEKVVLGSKWPTFSVNYERGYTGLFGSTVNYDKIEFGVKHKHRLGVFGTAEWRLESAKFINMKDLRQVDYKYQRQGDPYIYTNPFTTFQLLPTTFPTFDWYLEWHYLHRFNGVIMNKLPFLRKAGVRLVAGENMLYAFENNFKHIEVYGGAERVFRFWKERFRIGVYYAAGHSNAGFNNAIKFSIEYFDKQSQSWGF